MFVKEFRALIETLEYLYAQDRETGATPSETMKKYIAAVGAETAVSIVALMVRRVSWDGRISRNAKDWAAGITIPEDLAKREDDAYSEKIHTAHLNQLACAMPEALSKAEAEAEAKSNTMRVLIKKDAGNDYSKDKYSMTLKSLRGTWVNVDTQYLFCDQYNLADYDIRVFDKDIDAVQNDARSGLVKCGYCGAQFYGLNALQAHYAEEESNAHNCAKCRDYVKKCIDVKHSRSEKTNDDGNRIIIRTTEYIYGNACRWESGCNKLEHKNHKPFIFGPENTFFLRYPNGYADYFSALSDGDKWKEMGFAWDPHAHTALLEKADTGTYAASLILTPDGWTLMFKNTRREFTVPCDRVRFSLSNRFSVGYCMTYRNDNGREKAAFAATWEALPQAAKKAVCVTVEYLRDLMRKDYRRDFINQMEGAK